MSIQKQSRILTGLLTAGLISAHLSAQNVAERATALVNQGLSKAETYQASGNETARTQARRNFEEAEELVKDELKRNPRCEDCVAQLAAAQFYQSFFGFRKNYDDPVETTARGLASFPDNARLAFFQGYAQHQAGRHREAARFLQRYLASPRRAPETEGQVRELLARSQRHFMSGWYEQANFYQSKDARFEAFNAQANRFETLVQATPDFELWLGAQGLTQISQYGSAVPDPTMQRYLLGLAARLMSGDPGPPFPYRVTVVDSPIVNAMTPPGHIVIFTGLLRFARTEAELAGVMAHEIAHNYAHHSTRRLFKSLQAQSLVSMVGQALSQQSRMTQLLANLGSNAAVGLFVNAYSRYEEKEADLYAAHLMFNAGYAPTALTDFFLRMYEANPKQPIKFLSTHPPQPDRIAYLSEYLESFPLDRELVKDSPTFQAIKKNYPSLDGPATGKPIRPARAGDLR